MSLDLLSPMFDAGSRHFYVNEVAELQDGRKVIPLRWVTFKGNVYADAMLVETGPQNTVLVNETVTLIAAKDLKSNYLDLEHEGRVPLWPVSVPNRGVPDPARMLNPKHEIAGGDPLYTSFVDYFGDDVSENRSKSWNKHYNAYMTHRNLPRELLHQEFHVHFISSSPNASIPEQYVEFKAVVESTQREPVRVRDALTEATTRFSIVPHSGPSDNPMQSEICAHIGAQGNYPCRKCEVGGTQAMKREDDGFYALFEAGNPRSKEAILAELEKQVRLAYHGVAKPIGESQTASGIKDTYTQHWIQYLLGRFQEIKSSPQNTKSDADIEQELIQWTIDNRDLIYNSFLTTEGFDPTKDTPVEILHTILLGIVKYIWHGSHTRWTSTQKQLFALRLQSTDTDGLSIHAIRSNYIMQYAGSLIGRQFKTVIQTSIFHLRDLVTDAQFTAWRAVGELGALLWFPAISNIKQYLSDIKIAAMNVLDAFTAIDPTKMICKIKLHLLAHLPEDITSFGPLVGVATEIFEAFNAVFRFCSILSNHLAPSRDIARQLADQEGLKHHLMGGWWPSDTDGEWTHAGSGVRNFVNTHPVFQTMMGWSQPKELKIASVKLCPLPQKALVRQEHKLKATCGAASLNYHEYRPDSRWYTCRYVVSASREECYVRSWVFFNSPLTHDIAIGRISGIYSSVTPATPPVIVVIDVFQTSESRDEVYGMPVLIQRNREPSSVIVSAKDIQFKFNVQHDCATAKCEPTGRRPKKQEHRETSVMESFIEHGELERYFINLHAFHNAHLIRASLPRHLTVPVPLFTDRRTFHNEQAATLRRMHAQKSQAKKDGVKGKSTPPSATRTHKQKNAKDSGGRKKKRRTNGPADEVADSEGTSLAQGRQRRAVRRSWKLLEGATEQDVDDDEDNREILSRPELGDSDMDDSFEIVDDEDESDTDMY